MKHLITLALALFAGAAQAKTANCLPSTVGGTGTAAVGNVNEVGRWIGWYCPGDTMPTVYACRHGKCLALSTIATKLARTWTYTNVQTFNEAAYTLPDQYSVKDVWLRDADIDILVTVKPKP